MARAGNNSLVQVRMSDLALLLVAWQRSTGLREGAGIDPADVNRAAIRATDAIVNVCIEERAIAVKDQTCPHGLHFNGHYCEDCNG